MRYFAGKELEFQEDDSDFSLFVCPKLILMRHVASSKRKSGLAKYADKKAFHRARYILQEIERIKAFLA